ncbi:alpha-ketoglutarate-dependent dioxygenase AlkB [Hydrogenophaga sp.]|uniref:alpha-ketoglutarate-dependent dioxygenase AlkB n=1 Tax=Hydrogenophaga sp. TaxID=1904254 RepID=UPI00272730CF|nr:alpha-ketoglutarate-dependent dioxygenase AlkB [Hydrogenophaga sp.]MDO9434888.1 alpha-ketoglutarate-dependent dioxygenase AlkB [Hydrogenophaga sp.]
MKQSALFGDERIVSSIEGLVYEAGFLWPDEERRLIEVVESLPLQAAVYKQYTARRRVVSYGGSYDFDANRLVPSAPLDERLHHLRKRVAQWLAIDPEEFVHVLVAEYAPGTPLGWHRDVPDFETVVGVSLGVTATLRFRPYSEHLPRRVVRLEVSPRSIYCLTGEARWNWQHAVSPTNGLRWSITFRTKRA